MDPERTTRPNPEPLDDAALGALVREIADDWRMPPQRLDDVTWRDRVGRRGRSRRRWERDRLALDPASRRGGVAGPRRDGDPVGDRGLPDRTAVRSGGRHRLGDADAGWIDARRVGHARAVAAAQARGERRPPVGDLVPDR